ncbi:hypothetical protein [Pandoraea sputorum]|uniref:hypothetical protein n=1 Tax=Pandoraea sputorum TaxID=93222 RepID=UPI00123F7F90|nr:hypothetical protein [Pandoraea sputorum]
MAAPASGTRKKRGRKAARTPWRKLHLSIDPDMNIHGVAVSDIKVSDVEGLQAVLPEGMPVISPPSHAVSGLAETRRWHGRMGGHIREKASMHFGRNTATASGLRSRRRSRASCAASAHGLLTRKRASQDNEGGVIANLINLGNAFGRSVWVNPNFFEKPVLDAALGSR